MWSIRNDDSNPIRILQNYDEHSENDISGPGLRILSKHQDIITWTKNIPLPNTDKSGSLDQFTLLEGYKLHV